MALVVAALVIWRALGGGKDVPAQLDDAPPSPTESASAAAPPPPRPPAEPRCTEVSTEPFVIGEATPPKSAPEPNPGQDDAPELHEIDDPTAPFAVEIGRGAAFAGGFAVGARHDEKGGAVAMVATLGKDGRDGKLVRLARTRGDLDPPVVTGAGAAIVTVMVEPNAGGRALKVAKVEGGQVTWGPELSEGRDDSLALDVAATGGKAIVVWDDLVGTTKRSAVMLAVVDLATMRLVGAARPVSGQGEDAERPRLVARPGGYWLAYMVRGRAAPTKPRAQASGPSGKDKRADDDDDRELGEAITTSWLAVMPLDESGTPTGAARAVSAKGGHLLSYDLDLGEDGAALVAFRDDDTPTGSGGGRLLSALARLGGGGEPKVLVEETAATGDPDLLPGFLVLGSVSGATRIAAISPKGELLDELEPEKTLGAGEPVAATRDAILWARPMGKAMRLSVVRCKQRPLTP